MTFDPDFDSKPDSEIRSEFAGDPDMQEIIEMFVQDMPERISQLQNSWQTGEFEMVKRVAHQLKGASGGYGFSVLGTAASELEQGVKALASNTEDSQFVQVKTQLDALVEICRRVSAK
ncbi:MAG: Hpt domain-containing protein [Pyrinomonadaceae bacterium]|nr:Hpt domain-containing protein [Phycisphaerales bacterium]